MITQNLLLISGARGEREDGLKRDMLSGSLLSQLSRVLYRRIRAEAWRAGIWSPRTAMYLFQEPYIFEMSPASS